MTWGIIILTVIVSAVALNDHRITERLRFSPWMIRERSQGYRFLSYALVHADWIHLAVNMFVLHSFGRVTEMYYGMYFPRMAWFYYMLLYVGAVVISVTPAFAKHRTNPYYAAVGASGAVSAVVFTSIIMQPMAGIMIFPIPFDIPAIVFGALYLIYSGVMARRAVDNIGHDAHFWGALFGVVFTIALKPELFQLMIRQITV